MVAVVPCREDVKARAKDINTLAVVGEVGAVCRLWYKRKRRLSLTQSEDSPSEMVEAPTVTGLEAAAGLKVQASLSKRQP